MATETPKTMPTEQQTFPTAPQAPHGAGNHKPELPGQARPTTPATQPKKLG